MLIFKRLLGSLLILLGLAVGVLPFILHIMNDRSDPAFRALGTGAAPIVIGVWLWQRPKRKDSPELEPELASPTPAELAVRSKIAESRDQDSKPLNVAALLPAAAVVAFCIPPFRNSALTWFQNHPFMALLVCGGIVSWVGYRFNKYNNS
jgi:hypothetical protein